MVVWASAFVSIRSAGAYLAPGALAFGRLIVASLALGAVWLISDRRWPARAAWPGILGSGLLWFGLYMVTLNWGERDVDAGTCAKACARSSRCCCAHPPVPEASSVANRVSEALLPAQGLPGGMVPGVPQFRRCFPRSGSRGKPRLTKGGSGQAPAVPVSAGLVFTPLSRGSAR